MKYRNEGKKIKDVKDEKTMMDELNQVKERIRTVIEETKLNKVSNTSVGRNEKIKRNQAANLKEINTMKSSIQTQLTEPSKIGRIGVKEGLNTKVEFSNSSKISNIKPIDQLMSVKNKQPENKIQAKDKKNFSKGNNELTINTKECKKDIPKTNKSNGKQIILSDRVSSSSINMSNQPSQNKNSLNKKEDKNVAQDSSESEIFSPEKSSDYNCRNIPISQMEIKGSDSNLRKIIPYQDIINQKNYQIKKFRHLRNFRFSMNPRTRDRAGRQIQQWWWKIKEKIDYKNDLVSRVQSAWKGLKMRRKFRKMLDLITRTNAFYNKLHKVIRRYVLENYYHYLELKKKELLKRILKIKLWQYYIRWRDIMKKMIKREETVHRLVIMRKSNAKIIELKALYYHIWETKVNHAIQQELKDNERMDELRKHSSLNKIIMGLDKLSKRKGLKVASPNIMNFLYNKVSVRIGHSVLKLRTKLNKKALRHYLNQWRRKDIQTVFIKATGKIREKRLEGLVKQRYKSEIQSSFNKFKQGLIGELSTKLKNNNSKVIIPKAISHLANFSRYKGLRNIAEYIRKRNINRHLTHSLMVQQKHLYYKRYYNIVKILHNESRFNKIMKKNIDSLFKNEKNICFLKYFNKWKAISKEKNISLSACQDYNYITSSLQKYVNSSLLNEKEKLLFFLSKHVHKNRKQKAITTLFGHNSHYIKSHYLKTLSFYFQKWIRKVTLRQISDLKGKWLRNTSKHHHNSKEEKLLSNVFHHWKESNKLVKAQKGFRKEKNIIEGAMKLKQFKNQQLRKILHTISRPKQSYMKGKVLSNLSNIMVRQNSNISKAFNVWKRYQMKETFKSTNKNLTNKLHLKQLSLIHLASKQKFSLKNISKYFSRWYYKTIIIEDKNKYEYLKNLNNAVDSFNTTLHAIYNKQLFDHIKSSQVNPTNHKIIKLKTHIANNDTRNLYKSLEKWYNYSIYQKMLQLKGKSVLRTRKNVIQNFEKRKLLKKFMYWKLFHLYKKRFTCESLLKSFEYLTKGMINPILSEGFNAISNKSYRVNKDRMTREMYNKSNKKYELFLLDSFKKWKFITKRIEMKTAIPKIRIKVIAKEKNIILHYFNKWANFTKRYPVVMNQINSGGKSVFKTMIKSKKLLWQSLQSHVSLPFKSKQLNTKVLPRSLFSYKQKMIHCFNTWRLKKEKRLFEEYVIKKYLKQHLSKRRNDEKSIISQFFNKWNIFAKCLKPSISGKSLSSALLEKKDYLAKSILLRNISIRSYFLQWANRCSSISQKENEFLIFNKLMTPMFRKTLRTDIKYSFDKWRMCLKKSKEDNFKQKFMKCYLIRKDKDNQSILLKSKNNQWNQIAHSTTYKKEKLIQIPDQIMKLKRAISHHSLNSVMNLLANYSFNILKKKSVGTIMSKKTTEANQRFLRKSFNEWHNRMVSNNVASCNMKEMICLSRSYPKIRKQYDLIFLQKITGLASQIYSAKEGNSSIICNFTKGMFTIQNQMNAMKRTIKLRKQLNILIIQDQRNLQTKYKAWNRKANQTYLNENAKVIQQFIKSKHQSKKSRTHKTNQMYNCIDSALENSIRDYFYELKFNTRQLPTKISKQNMINKQITRVFKNKERIDNYDKSEHFNRWKSRINRIQKHEAGNKIIMNIRKYSSKKCLGALRQKKKFLSKRISSLSKENNCFVLSYFSKWRAIAKSMLINEKSILIQSFLQEKIKNKKELRILRSKNMKICKGVDKFNETFDDHVSASNKLKLFTKLHDNCKDQHLNALLKKIPNTVINYYQNEYFYRWKDNTITSARNKITKLQNTYKSYLNLNKTRKTIKTQKFFTKYLNKLTEDNIKILRINYLHWVNQVAKQRIDEPIVNLQKNLKGFILRKKTFPKLQEEEKQTVKETKRLQRKIADTHRLILKWENPLMKYWVKLKKKDTPVEIKKKMLVFYSKRSANQSEVMTCLIRKWQNKTNQMNATDHIKEIQQFLMPKLKKVLHNKGVNQMLQLSKLMVNRKLNHVAKFNLLSKKLIRYPYHSLIQGLDRNKKQLVSLSKIFSKKDEKNDFTLKKAFHAYQIKVSISKLNYNAKIIQQFVQVSKQTTQLKNKNNNIKQGFDSFHKILLKMGFSQIKSESNKEILLNMNDLISEHITLIKSECFKSLIKTRTNNHLNRLIQIISSNKVLSLHFYFNKWNNVNIKSKKIQSCQKIQQKYRIYRENEHKKKVNTVTTSIFRHLSNKNTSKLAYYFIHMKRQTQISRLKSEADIISSFVYVYNQNRKSRNNWIKYTHKLLKYNKMNEIKQMSQRQKIVVFFNKIDNSFKNKIQKTLSLIHRYNQESVLNKQIKKNQLKVLQFNYDKWKRNGNFIKLQSALNNSFLSLGKQLKEGMKRNKVKSVSKIYKIFIYKIMSRVFSSLTTSCYLQGAQAFYGQIRSLIKSKALYSYNKTVTLNKLPTIKELSFKGFQSHKKTIDKKRYLLIITPLFRNYLLAKMSKINAFTFDRILIQSLPYIFANHLRRFNKERMLIQKKYLTNRLQTASKKLDLHMFIDEAIKQKLKDSMQQIIKRKKLFIVISKTMINKFKAKVKATSRTISGWKCYVGFIKSQKWYLEQIENSYLSIYKDFEDVLIGGGNESSPSVIDELISFNNKANK